MSIKFIVSDTLITNTLIPTRCKLYEMITVNIDDQFNISITTGTYELDTHQLEVYLNGILQYVSLDYIEANETMVSFILPLKKNDKVLFIVRATSSN